jgi:flagellar biosynthesis protein FlhA
VRRLIEPVMPAVPVISLAELPARVGLRTVALWEMKNA